MKALATAETEHDDIGGLGGRQRLGEAVVLLGAGLGDALPVMAAPGVEDAHLPAAGVEDAAEQRPADGRRAIVVAHQDAVVVGVRADDGNGAEFLAPQRQQAVVLEQDDAVPGGVEGQLAVALALDGVVGQLGGGVGLRGVEQPQLELQLQLAEDRLIQFGGVQQAATQRLARARAVLLAVGDDVDARVQLLRQKSRAVGI